MRLSKMPLTTLKEVPADAEIVSHKLMLRAAMIRKLAAGIYNWLPVGFRVMKKVEAIVREEMDAAGALELLMPSVQPAELWHESGRWDGIGAELLKFHDRHQRDFCYGPTHEEVITDIARNVIRSYKQLPVNYYQIQTKFRDEIRPRFGVMRSREFIMKDAYSFDLDSAGMARSYAVMHDAYVRIFTRLGLKFRPVQADSGNIGGSASEEFHVLADSGEDAIAFSDTSSYAANVEMAVAVPPDTPRPAPGAAMESIQTPQARTIAQVSAMLDVAPERCLKTLLVKGDDGGSVALVLRGDHELNPLKAEKLDGIASPLALAEPGDISAAGSVAGFVGPVGLSCPVIADHAALATADFVCGANEADRHLRYVNWVRDLPEPAAADLRNVRDGDPSPDGQGRLSIARGIEVGHIFQLGTKYSDSLGARVLDENGKEQTLYMGCYGIGVTRIVAAAIEQNHDDNGIIWPDAIAPWHIALIPINMHKSERLANAANDLYENLAAAGYEVMFDDRNARPGVKFADADLLGIPHRLVISDRGLDAGELEYKHRRADDSRKLPADQIMAFLEEHVEMKPA